MAADQPRLPPGGASPRARLRWLLIVVAVMVLLTAGWPLLNALVADKQQLAAGVSLRVGPSGPNSASLRVGPGWTLRPAESDPRQCYLLRRGAVTVSISYASLVGAGHAAGIWSGLRRVFQIRHPGIRLGKPAAVTSGQGRPGLRATATGAHINGDVTGFVGPSGTYAIEIVVLAPRYARPVAAAASLLLIRWLRFPVAPR
jgi:hypothetical protein